jgi:hypothetical protein
MAPIWSNQIAKQYNKDMTESEVKYNIDKSNKEVVRTACDVPYRKPKDAINPSHYQGIVGNYQYIECMEFILGYEGLKAHLMGQIYKYMMRMGKKDSEQQELGKVIWYSRCLQILLRDNTIIGKLGELK